MKKIVCFHLLNDYSGSPKVLNLILKGLSMKGYEIDLVTSRNTGILDELSSCKYVKMYRYRYLFSNNPLFTILRYLYVQVYTFAFSFRYIFRKNIIFYINTLLPVGPALAGRLMGKRVVYHYHENAFAKGLFYKTLAYMMQCLASNIICVSNFQRNNLKKKKHAIVIPNSLSTDYEKRCRVRCIERNNKTVLMLSSLKLYKGILEFVQLSERLPQYHFLLVVNDTQKNIEKFCTMHNILRHENLELWDRQLDVFPFYERASLVLNLSNRKKVLETFGLTVLEAMTMGLPVIVPTEGGIAEMVEDGVNGYKIDVQNLDEIENEINKILSDKLLYQSLCENAKKLSENYSYVSMIDKIDKLLGN